MNGPTYCLIAGLGIAAAAAHREQLNGDQLTSMPVAAGVAGAFCTNLLDILEPATSPNHRKVFHSVACAVVLIAGLKKAGSGNPRTTSGSSCASLLSPGSRATWPT